MHNSEVGYIDGLSVKRHVKWKKGRVEIDGPKAQSEYVKYFNAVDRNDRDSADYSTSIRTNRYYLCIMCLVLDRVVHTCFARNTDMTGCTAEKKTKCRTSRLGCVICREEICKICWKLGYDKHR